MTTLFRMALPVAALFAGACWQTDDQSASASDADVDGDSDGDSDADGDTDGDADGDGDTDPGWSCSYQCLNPLLCTTLGGETVPSETCPYEGQVCCDAPPGDTEGWPEFVQGSGDQGEVADSCWAAAVGSPGDDSVGAVSVMPDQSLVVVGQLGGPALFGEGQINETLLEPAIPGPTYEAEGFLARYTADGILAWARLADVQPNTLFMPEIRMEGVAATEGGGIAVTGYFWGQAFFGLGEPGETSISCPVDEHCMFLARYYGDGFLEWVRHVPGLLVRGQKLVVLPGGDIVVVGSLAEGPAVFGLGEPGQMTVAGADPDDPNETQLFVASYAADGTFLWVDTHETGNPRAAVLDADGRILVVGRFEQEAIFEQGEPGEISLESWPEVDFIGTYVVAFDQSGQTVWARAIQGSTYPSALVALGDGGSILAADFHTTPVYLPSLGTEGFAFWPASSMFITRLDGQGFAQWARQMWIQEDSFARVEGMALAQGNEVAVAGTFRNAVGFGDPLVEEHWLFSDDTNQPFVAWYDDQGDLTRIVRAAEWSEAGESRDIAVPPDGTAFFAGTFYESASFDAGDGQWTSLTSEGQQDGLLVSLCP